MRRPNCKMGSETVLLILTLVGVILGVVIGAGIKSGIKEDPQLTPRQLMALTFPGEMFLRMLKLIILPLMISALVTSLASLDSRVAGRIGVVVMTYYTCTTVTAVITGIIVVLLIKPGTFASTIDYSKLSKEGIQTCQGLKPEDTVMDMIRNIFPSNLVEAGFTSVSTCVRYKKLHGNDSGKVLTYDEWKQLNYSSEYYDDPYVVKKDGLNILGLIVFSLVLGMIINKMGDEGRPLAKFFQSLQGAMMRMVNLVIWFSPIGIMFLIAGQISAMDDLVKELQRLGMYMVTVLVGLFIHGCITLPLSILIIGRRNPIKFVYGMMQSYLTALGTASSLATMPLTMKCIEENNKIDRRVSRFIIPLGGSINGDGTALYEAVAAIYIAQTLGMSMGIGEVIMVSLTATLAGIGATGIPQAGLVTMLMVLLAVGLPAEMYTLIVPVDWLLDRIRTMVNVHGDSCGCVIVERLCKQQLAMINDEELAKIDVAATTEETGKMNGHAKVVRVSSGTETQTSAL